MEGGAATFMVLFALSWSSTVSIVIHFLCMDSVSILADLPVENRLYRYKHHEGKNFIFGLIIPLTARERAKLLTSILPVPTRSPVYLSSPPPLCQSKLMMNYPVNRIHSGTN